MHILKTAAMAILLAALVACGTKATPGVSERDHFFVPTTNVEKIWRDYHVNGTDAADRRWKREKWWFIRLEVNTIEEMEDGGRIISYFEPGPLGRVQLEFVDYEGPFNLQSLSDFVLLGSLVADCRVAGLSSDSSLLLEDCELVPVNPRTE